MSALAWLPSEEFSWVKLLFVLLFLGAPALKRFFEWLKARSLPSSPMAADEEPDTLRESRRRAEAEGGELWRRLARGEVSAAPPARPAPVPLRSAEEEQEDEEDEAEEAGTSLELEEEPAPLSMLGEVSEPGEVNPASLEDEAPAAPLAALKASAELSAGESSEGAARGFVFGRGDLRRGMILSEILGPPLSERKLRA